MAQNSEANSAAWNAAGQAASAGIAAIGQSVATKKQFARSKELMALQMQNQEKMNDSAYMRQMQMWEDTNYDAQVDQMKKAGLNVGLMYGGSGGGGSTVTTGSNSAGGASGGHSPQAMDIGSIVSASKMMAELSMMKAQTKKTNEEAEAQAIDNEIMISGGKDAQKAENTNKYLRSTGEYNAFLEDNEMYQKQSKSETDKTVNEAILSEMKTQAEEAGIKLTKERTNEIWHSIRQKWLAAGMQGLGTIVKTAMK